jgi:hypothetical protein
MKRYWVFVFRNYYPGGGLDDLDSTHHGFVGAVAAVGAWVRRNYAGSDELGAQILDTKRGFCKYRLRNYSGWKQPWSEWEKFPVEGVARDSA